MIISSLQLLGFRSYTDSEFEFSPGVNIVVGPNASGKTNLLEALLVMCQGVSYRADLAQLINHDVDAAVVLANVDDRQRRVSLSRGSERTTRALEIDGVPRRLWRATDNLPAVLFEPEHLLLVTGTPSLRRAYMDGILEQTVPGYKAARQRYVRSLRQRNRLLKSLSPYRDDELFVWDVQLCDHASYLVAARLQLVSDLNQVLTEHYSAIAGQPAALSAAYDTSLPSQDYSSQLLRRLHANKEKDALRGFTSCGPHRDDLILTLNGQSAASSASRGETRSLVLSLKLAERSIIETVFSSKPLLLLDDVFSELDTTRQKALAKALEGSQTLLTTTNADTWVRFGKQHFETILLG